MKRLFFAILFCALLLSGCSNSGYKEGYRDGYAAASENVEADLESKIHKEWQDGYDFGYEEGFYDAKHDGSLTYDEGFADGEFSGYYAGAVYTCLFFNDIDRAFASATNGSAWYAFVDSWDELIENIYDSDEERSEIVWSLVSVMVSEEFTKDEAELLEEKFGLELFARNGINLDL